MQYLERNKNAKWAMVVSWHSLTRDRVQETPSQTFASPWERFECLVICLTILAMQITRR